jgi:hypothetical protein
MGLFANAIQQAILFLALISAWLAMMIWCHVTSLQVLLANSSAFGLGSYCFSGNQARAVKIGSQIKSGMFVVNDYASNAMCQSLPFGGVKESGFDRCTAFIPATPCTLTYALHLGHLPGVADDVSEITAASLLRAWHLLL